VHSLSFAGSIQRLRLQLPAETAVQSAIESTSPAQPLLLEVTRNSSEQSLLPLAPGQRVAIGVRRVHLLPTPISSFRLLADSSESAAKLRRAPLLAQLAHSMRARIIDVAEAAEQDGLRAQLGVAVLGSGLQSIPLIVSALARGTQRLLCLPEGSVLPKRVVICTDNDAARPATLALVASVLRHLPGEATFVSVQSPDATRADVAASFRRLLDARAELLESHGLDIRTDVQIGALDDWLARLTASEEDTLIVLGLNGDASGIEAALRQRFQPLFGGRCPVLLSCSSASATQSSVAGALSQIHADAADSRPPRQ
jgi:hypothetical protein